MALYPEIADTGPFEISATEANEHGEAEVQLVEGRPYWYRLSSPRFHLKPHPSLVRPGLVRDLNECEQGRITPGLNVGRIRIALLSTTDDSPAGLAEVEVRSTKANYRTEYRRMLEYITVRCTDLLLEFRSPAEQSVLPEEAREPETICQRFAFVRALITSRQFRDAVQRVIALPHRLWEQEEDQVPLSRGVKPSASVARQIASASRRVPLPSVHPLASRMTSVPERVTILHNVETVDTAENRFVKHALRTFHSFAATVHARLLQGDREKDARFIEEAEALEEELGEILNRAFFRAVSDPQMLPLGSPVLQRKGGYREILAAWLQFDMAARLHWKGGENVYGAGKRDVATLYEYWLFFKLLEVVAAIFHLNEPQAKSLIESTEDGFGLKLQSGRHIPLEGEYTAEGGGRRLKVRFSYNRTFPRKGSDTEKNFPDAGSWTERMRPDYTLTLWPADFTEAEAERQEVIVHVHFDAKYRVKDLPEMFGAADEDLPDEAALNKDLNADKAAQQQGCYHRADLLKMHAYKDAIRRTAGAYVLYPGAQNRNWQGFHEIVPGLGAFGIRPSEDGDDGTTALKDFILLVVQHVCDRATRREQETYHRYRIQDPAGPGPLAVREALAEYDMAGRRARPPRETPVLVAWYQNETQLRWTDEKGLLILRIGEKRGAVPLTPENVGAYYILLHKKDQEAATGLYAVLTTPDGKPTPPEVITAATLKRRHHYPLATGSDHYLVYRVESAPEFAHTRWNVRQLLTRRGIAEISSPLPFTATLDEVLNCAH
jgi:predicted component of viral defense system (DUF524 family)